MEALAFAAAIVVSVCGTGRMFRRPLTALIDRSNELDSKWFGIRAAQRQVSAGVPEGIEPAAALPSRLSDTTPESGNAVATTFLADTAHAAYAEFEVRIVGDLDKMQLPHSTPSEQALIRALARAIETRCGAGVPHDLRFAIRPSRRRKFVARSRRSIRRARYL